MFPVFSTLGEVDGNPIICVKFGEGPKKVLLTGVVHGDEPAGMDAIIEFFKNHAAPYVQKFSFVGFPCINPNGYERKTRANLKGINLNRDFKNQPESEEIKLILPTLEQYEFTMDLHETWPNASRVGEDEPNGEDPSEFFLWETTDGIRYGGKIVEAIERLGLSVCKWPKIYGDTNSGGAIYYPEACGTPCYASSTSLDSYLFAKHTRVAYTIETPLMWKMEDRVLAHVTAIKTRLDLA